VSQFIKHRREIEMFKNKIILVAVAMFLGMSGISFAASCGMSGTSDSGQAYAQNEKAGAKIVDAGNKSCPVLGGKVSGKDFYVYKGKRYGLCCPMCESTFKADPEKYAAIADKEVGK